MKIGILVGYFPLNRGGAEYQAFLLSNFLKNENEVFYISVGHDRNEVFYENGFKIYLINPIKLPFLGSIFFLSIFRILAILFNEKPNAIYQRVGFSLTFIAGVYRYLNSKVKYYYHIANRTDVTRFRDYSSYLQVGSFIEKYLQEMGIRFADLIICQSYEQKELLKENYGYENTIVIYNSYPQSFKPKNKKLDPLRICWIANIKKSKRPELFLQIVRKLTLTNLEFTMVGRSGNSQFMALIKDHCLKYRNLRYVGELSQDEVNDLLVESHILVNTSDYEGFSSTFIQSMLAGTAILSLNSDPDGLIEKNKIGFKVDSVDEICKKIFYYKANPEELKLLAQRSFELASKRFSMMNIEELGRLIIGD